jgi:hypothetical protein
MSYTAGSAAWKLAFQLSPIVLVNGWSANFPVPVIPIIALTEAANFTLGMLSGGDVNLDRFFANYQPLPGSSLIEQDVGEYPFANQAVAANAVITRPRTISMLMICPAQNRFGYWERLAIITALKEVFDRHNSSGGTYIVATPSYIYTNCLMTRMVDASLGNTKQPQSAWQIDFRRPLVTIEEAEQAQNGLFSILSSGAAIPGNPSSINWSGLATGVGIPASVASSSLIPGALSSAAANTTAAAALAGGIAPL